VSDTSSGRISKARRQHLIVRLLAEHEVTSQEQLVDLLAAEGVSATQATVSRDLEEIGAVKVRVPGVERLVYAVAELPRHQVAPAEHLRRVLGEWVVEVSSSLNLVVLRTPPGSAHVVASALDRSGLDGALGTVAGDDTLLVIADEETGGAELARQLAEMAGQQQTGM
jgi:transcriptional regulator of arginine metabolism